MAIIEETARITPVRHTADVLVVGGGAAGMAAAVAARRLGADVLLVERNGYLGGTLSMVTLGSICGLYAVTPTEVIPVVAGFASEFVERMQRLGGSKGPLRWLETASLPYDPTIAKLVGDEMASEAQLRVAFHSQAVDVVCEENRVNGVIFESRDGRWACLAKVIIDCTGNADIASLAGAEFEHDPAEIQAPTTMFRFGGVDTERTARMTRDELRRFLEEAVAAGMPLPRTAGGMFSPHPGSMHLNITRVLKDGRSPDPLNTAELTEAEMEGRRQLRLYLEAFRRFVPGYENAYIADVGAEIGVRESRRIVGDYRLTLEDVLGEARFEDSIACSAWPVEEHGAGRATRWVFLKPGTFYELPYRMMLPAYVDGLLVAGRCASATHDAHASMRVAGVCMALGEAAGVAAAQAVLAGANAPDLRKLDIGKLQAQLGKQGAIAGAHAVQSITATAEKVVS
ncbi:FAD dependent oxidoreductase [Ancylobacter novellus DSM 506]|uniref:FAD dependent oxidoreductase n=1 Tax=Ancylobacter novellus (strain ATCC 8093 / DSM 506 / JCM 20403 / CCM 1077 / IAM 12100 / NBRC 12443 / NCIMB 10456) TaxID=639283 RepID=D7A2Q3_ANCN5|nr:FAD-dependent oxidoreductase [Ancylobacter novellus]ADH91583.1 FAD dependent oxidoreductase [Ancylobacter novellus DSM 506]